MTFVAILSQEEVTTFTVKHFRTRHKRKAAKHRGHRNVTVNQENAAGFTATLNPLTIVQLDKKQMELETGKWRIQEHVGRLTQDGTLKPRKRSHCHVCL